MELRAILGSDLPLRYPRAQRFQFLFFNPEFLRLPLGLRLLLSHRASPNRLMGTAGWFMPVPPANAGIASPRGIPIPASMNDSVYGCWPPCPAPWSNPVRSSSPPDSTSPVTVPDR